MTRNRTASCAAVAVFLAGGAILAGALPAGAGTSSGEIKGYAAKCADDTGNSSALRTRIQIWSCTGGAAQQWSFSGGELRRAGMCMNDKGWGGSGSPVILWGCDGAANEAWSRNAAGGYVLKANGLCLDDPAFSVRNGTRLIVYRCNGGANQRWSLPVAPAPAPTPTPTPTDTPTSAGCHPLTDAGGCYEPGELCRDSDHGVTGVAGDGETIVCEDVNGWRWEPA